MLNNNIYDWQIPLWSRLMLERERLPHALLLAGPQGLGKFDFAKALTMRLLCESSLAEPADQACGKCSSCVWLASGNHPDFRLVQPEENGDGEEAEIGAIGEKPGKQAVAGQKQTSGTIGIDQIRALEDFVFVGSHRHGGRIVMISPAEGMTASAANSLLKILEEPPSSVYFILISSLWRRLLPTIRSRCHSVFFDRPDQVLAERWLTQRGIKPAGELLRLAGGAPLVALEWVEQGRFEVYRKVIDALTHKTDDPIAMAAKWAALLKTSQEFGLPHLVDAVQKWLFDLVQIKLSGSLRYHETWNDTLQKMAMGASGTALMSCYNDLMRIRSVVRHPLNTQLFLEDMAARYLRALATDHRL